MARMVRGSVTIARARGKECGRGCGDNRTLSAWSLCGAQKRVIVSARILDTAAARPGIAYACGPPPRQKRGASRRRTLQRPEKAPSCLRQDAGVRERILGETDEHGYRKEQDGSVECDGARVWAAGR